MPRLSSLRKKRYTRTQTTLRGSHHSSWFEAIEILGEKDAEYLVRWAGKNPDTGEEWENSWV